MSENNNVIPFRRPTRPPQPRPNFVFELQSERIVSAMYALHRAGFRVTHIRGTDNRFRIEDAKEDR